MESSALQLFDWQVPRWNALLADSSRLAHALLLGGPEGMGKRAFGQTLAARLLCEQADAAPSALPCGKCNSCNWLSAGNHPDFRVVQPEEAGAESDSEDGEQEPAVLRKLGQSAGQVRIDQIRSLDDFVYVGSHRQGNRIVLISQAETMTPQAANSLLKILEEPPASVYFIVISSQWRRLLPTLLSRCRSLIFASPDTELARRWLGTQGSTDAPTLLDLAGGAPLVALDWAEQGRLDIYRKLVATLTQRSVDPVTLAAKWAAMLKSAQEFALPQLLDAIQKWMLDLSLQRLSGQCRYHAAWRDQLADLARSVSAPALLACYNDLLKLRAVVRHPLNTQLFLEDLAARYLRALAPVKH